MDIVTATRQARDALWREWMADPKSAISPYDLGLLLRVICEVTED